VTKQSLMMIQAVVHGQLGSNVSVRVRLQSAAQRVHVITALSRNTAFNVCVELTVNQSSDAAPAAAVVSCRPATTSPGGGGAASWLSSVELVVGVSVGGGLAAVLVVSTAVYCCCAAARRRRRALSTSGAPKRSVQTKRFRKFGAASPPAAAAERTSGDPDVERAIAESVERLDPYSKEALANLLRSASAYSLDHIGGGGGASADERGQQHSRYADRPTSTAADRHYYEALPDDTYDQIPTDDFV